MIKNKEKVFEGSLRMGKNTIKIRFFFLIGVGETLTSS